MWSVDRTESTAEARSRLGGPGQRLHRLLVSCNVPGQTSQREQSVENRRILLAHGAQRVINGHLQLTVLDDLGPVKQRPGTNSSEIKFKCFESYDFNSNLLCEFEADEITVTTGVPENSCSTVNHRSRHLTGTATPADIRRLLEPAEQHVGGLELNFR